MKHKGISPKELKKRLDAMPPTIPNPGSDEALDRGCSCPCMDNNHGRGGSYYGIGIWITTADCPLHGMTGKQAADAKQKAEPETSTSKLKQEKKNG